MCGIFGTYGLSNAVEVAQIGIFPVRHRGKGSIGLAVRDSKSARVEIAKTVDYADNVFEQPKYRNLHGDTAIAHVRWPTAGPKDPRNAQPHYTQSLQGRLVISANGDIVNMDELRQLVLADGIRVYSDNDAEMLTAVIYHFLQKGFDLFGAIKQMKQVVRGAYSAVLLADWEDALYAFRDELGIRPMILGYLDNRYVIASESCQFQAVGAQFIREVYPGEVLRINDNGINWPDEESRGCPKCTNCHFCSIEDVYFARPDSYLYLSSCRQVSYSTVRFELGRQLAKEFPVVADMVVPVPRSGIPAAEGFAAESGISCQHVIVTEGVDIGRTFIETELRTRAFLANLKYTMIKDRIAGKSVVVVDDSLIRGLTMMVIVKKLFEAGASQVHVRIPSPRYVFPCYYGVDTKRNYELIAKDKNDDEQRMAIGSPTTLRYLSVEGFQKVLRQFHPGGSCLACFTGKYPI